MGSREEKVQGRGLSEKALAASQGSSGLAREIRDSIEQAENPVSTAEPAAEVTAFVDGQRVKTLYVFMRYPAHLITEDKGTHECTRVFVVDGKCKAGTYLDNRIGPGRIQRVELSTTQGLRITTDRGVIWSPLGDCQATYVP